MFDELMYKYKKLLSKNGFGFSISIVKEFCVNNKLLGIDGLPGLLEYIEKVSKRDVRQLIPEDEALIKSFGEIAFMLWEFKELGRIDLPNAIANQMINGGDYGDTKNYEGKNDTNYFRNFELELQVGLRFLEKEYNIRPGSEGEPDYYIDNSSFVVEVKAPASKKALFQDILKAVKQIEKSKLSGVIVLELDHMVKRGMIDNTEGNLNSEIVDIIVSALPCDNKCYTKGAVIEWVDWNKQNPQAIVQAVMNKKLESSQNKELILKVIEPLIIECPNESQITVSESNHQFIFDNIEEVNPTIDGENFYNKYWN